MKIFTLAACLLFPAAAFAQDAPVVHFICKPAAQIKADVIKGGMTWTVLNDAQWNFMRGFSLAFPGAPSGMPPGGTLVLASNNSTSLAFFIDGAAACLLPLPLDADFIKMLKDVGTGKISHAGKVV